MTILPKKKPAQQKNDPKAEAADPNSFHGHQSLTQDGRDRFTFSSPQSWPPPNTRDEKRPAHATNSNFDDYENVENGPSHSKRRHRASPHRSIRKSHTHSHRSNATQSYTTTPGTSQGSMSPLEDRSNSAVSTQAIDEKDEKDPSGYNSGDEYDRPLWTEEESEEKEKLFEKKLRKKGYMIKKMDEDGACLFRAVADQVYGDQEMHSVVRKLCMDYMAKNSDHYSQYITEDFDKYLERKRCDHIHGNHVEMQAMSEMFNRPIEVYHYSPEPINIFHGMQKTDNEPIRLSYHRNVHYNSIVDPYKATVGVGLGLPSFIPGLADKNLVTDAIRASEDTQIEQTMLEDKLRATDWEATNEAIEEQVARESYLEWLRENEMRARKKTRSATATCSSSLASDIGGMSPHSAGRISPRSRTNSPRMDVHMEEKILTAIDHVGSPKAGCSRTENSPRPEPVANKQPAETTSNANILGQDFSLIETASFINQLPPSVFGLSDWEDTDILARVLAESQQEYLDSLKRSATKENAS